MSRRWQEKCQANGEQARPRTAVFREPPPVTKKPLTGPAKAMPAGKTRIVTPAADADSLSRCCMKYGVLKNTVPMAVAAAGQRNMRSRLAWRIEEITDGAANRHS